MWGDLGRIVNEEKKVFIILEQYFLVLKNIYSLKALIGNGEVVWVALRAIYITIYTMLENVRVREDDCIFK